MTYEHEITEIEAVCGVTMADIQDMLGKILIRGNSPDTRRIIFPQYTSAALASSVARCVAEGASVEFAGLNSLSQPVYTYSD